MRIALWESAPGALAALLQSRQPLQKADLYTLTLANGQVHRWSGSDVALSGGGNTWQVGPGLRRTRVRFTVGIEVDTMQLTINDITNTTLNSQALIPFIRAGGLQGARLQLDRAFWGEDDAAPVGALMWFSGRISTVPKIDRYEAQINVKSDLELLDVKVPRDVYQTGCLNTLYDSNCGAVRAARAVAGLAGGTPDPRRITFMHALQQPPGYFDLGVATMTSGANIGAARTIKLHTVNHLTVLQPWPAPVQVGDTFSLVPGCNKSHTDPNGCPKFFAPSEVAVHFRGMPYVPTPETAF